MDAGRGAGRDRRPADRAVGEDDVDLDRRITARIEDLARVDDVDEVFSSGLRLRAFLAGSARPGDRAGR
jgi:hypothetical protein